jgi:NitT/TauT family transport system substrate-binding protein
MNSRRDIVSAQGTAIAWRRVRWPRYLRLLALVSAASLLAACGGGASEDADNEGTAAETEAPVQLTIALAAGTKTAVFNPFYVADANGIWAEHGLEVETLGLTPAAAIPAFLNGDAEIAVISATGAVPAVLDADDGSMIVASMGSNIVQFWARPTVGNVRELKAENIGMSTPGGVIDAAARGALTKAGLNPDTDVKLVYLQSAAGQFSALQSDQLAAAALTPPTIGQAEKAGFVMLQDISDFAPPLPILVKGEFYRDHPEAVGRVLEALKEAIQQSQDDPDMAVQVFLATGVAGDLATAEDSITPYLQQWQLSTYPIEVLEPIIDGADSSVEPSSIVDDDIIKEVGPLSPVD